MIAPLVFLPGEELSLPELCSARLDGLLHDLGEGFVVADVPDGPALRALAIAPLLAPGFAVSGPSAAWVHGMADAPPTRHHIQRFAARRRRPRGDPRVVAHETALNREDVDRPGDVPVVSPVRTLVDLALALPRHPEHSHWLQALAYANSAWPRRARESLRARQRVPGKAVALRALDALADDQDEVTR